MIRWIDMFCGIGGFRLGLEKASKEFKCVWANDIDKNACKIYRKHWPDGTLYEGDIRTVDADAIPDHELLCAGFPCQSFSIAGNRRGYKDTRGTLFFEICRVIQAKKTPFIILENVKGLLSHDKGTTAFIIFQSLDELGYDCQWQVLNSYDFGKGERPRIFILAVLRDYANNGWQRDKKALPLPVGCGTGIRYEDFDEQENMRDSERIVRTYARLPDWLDSWDTLYQKKAMPRKCRNRKCDRGNREATFGGDN